MATSTPAKKTEKSARRTPAQIQQAVLDGTLEKLAAARARRTRLEEGLAKATSDIEYLTALADNQSSHPALKKADEAEDEDQNEAVIGAI